MPKAAPTLDTPFRRGEKVRTTRAIGDHPEGSMAKIKLVNGLDQWMRYWVRFGDGDLIGQIDHHDLVRPAQLDDWVARQEARANASVASATEDAPAAAAVGGGDGSSSLIPANLLERSKAAKARLLGG